MGVPKFFRWLSERYPKINQPIHCPPSTETRNKYFPEFQDDVQYKINKNSDEDPKDVIHKSCLLPEFDRLYVDMNGIIHCCSHNNASDTNTNIDPDLHIDSILNTNQGDLLEGTVNISEEEIFRNVAYYLDRLVGDIVQPKELLFLAIDGVAPRAKMNQQRARRYRSGKEKEIEGVFFEAMQQNRRAKEEMERKDTTTSQMYETMDESDVAWVHAELSSKEDRDSNGTVGHIQEVEPGRFAGKFQTSKENSSDSNPNYIQSLPFTLEFQDFIHSPSLDTPRKNTFHSNAITPGTEFFDSFSSRLEQFIQDKLRSDPKWSHLTIILSGPSTPGEGEHKIMDFIRKQKQRKEYNPNTRHCLLGQDGDLILLGLATHEPHFCLLREEVIFDQAKKRKRLIAGAEIDSSQSSGKKDGKYIEDKKDNQSASVDASNLKSEFILSIDSYIHNTSFELLHMSTLRDYIAYEFETKEVMPGSAFELEATIDDFVFMTFFVGNDFLPHMPALDIQDEAFDLLFYTYKRNRYKWLRNSDDKKNINGDELSSDFPYLTKAGEIISGKRLESFLRDVGSFEDPYYDNKKRNESLVNSQIRKADERAGRKLTIPSEELLAAKEEYDRSKYKAMLESYGITHVVSADIKMESTTMETDTAAFIVSSNKHLLSKLGLESSGELKIPQFEPQDIVNIDDSPMSNMKTLIKSSLSPISMDTRSDASVAISAKNDRNIKSSIDLDKDLKGRYYYEKFKFSPFDKDKHVALRQAYVEGLVWNLAYYYKGCISWDWYYPYHYGPMLSDLVNLDEYVRKDLFVESNSKPLKPFDQLMACLPPSCAYLLPKPYQWLMRSPKSPIKEFYPESFTVDMNGKRWPWEAVVLLPFIDSGRLVNAVNQFVSDEILSSHEAKRNVFKDAVVYSKQFSNEGNIASSHDVVRVSTFYDSPWEASKDESRNAVFRPVLLPGSDIPLAGFPSLREAPVQSLIRLKCGINIFGMRSRYKSAILKIESDIPAVPDANVLAKKFIGTTIYFRYPYFQEGFVTAISDISGIVRGNESIRQWTAKEKELWHQRNKALLDQCTTGEGITGSGGCAVINTNCILSLRPLKEIRTLSDGTKVKVFARGEVDVPLVAVLWGPSRPDPRLKGLPAYLEKNPYRFGPKLASVIPLTSSKNIDNRQFQRLNFSTVVSSSVKNKYRLSDTSHVFNQFQIKRLGCYDSLQNTKVVRDRILPSMVHKRSRSKMLAFASFSLATLCFLRAPYKSHAQQSLSKIVIGPQNIPYTLNGLQFKSNCDSHCVLKGEDAWETPRYELNTPPLQFAHGTTTLSFIFKDGIVAAVDSRASIGNFVGSKTTQKVLPVNKLIIGTMAGGAADCSFWIRMLQKEAKYHELVHGRSMTVGRASRILANALHRNKGIDLSIGTMIMGYDDHCGPSIYYVDNQGVRIRGDMFAVGSGSTFALGVLDTERRMDMTEEEAVALGIKAIRHATFRDAYSGGFIAVYVINKKGWRKVFSEDLIPIANSQADLN